MNVADVVKEGVHFVQGDEACAMGAIAAGCRFCSYYPITPVSEISEAMARMLPYLKGVAIQMEDEIGSMHAANGATVAGVKALTCTSGPGCSVHMDGYGWAIKNEVPVVIVDVQRAGPSNGVATLVGQGDFYQAKYGLHGGNCEVIALAPWNGQETFDLMIEAFNLSETYRIPVMFMLDEVIAHTREKLVVPPMKEIQAKLVERKRDPGVPREQYKSFGHIATPDAISVPFPAAGDGFGVCISPYTHNEMGYPSISLRDQDRMVRRLIQKVRAHRDELVKFEADNMDGARTVVASYGCSARSALTAVKRLRKDGAKVDFFRFITLWPFMDKQVKALAEKADTIYVVENNLDGQLSREVERASQGKTEVVHIGKAGVEMHTPDEVVEAIQEHIAQASRR
ncbi:2-oxoacid:acceptor oxidoreductase subunit alpha [Chloroflexota bacterium]